MREGRTEQGREQGSRMAEEGGGQEGRRTGQGRALKRRSLWSSLSRRSPASASCAARSTSHDCRAPATMSHTRTHTHACAARGGPGCAGTGRVGAQPLRPVSREQVGAHGPQWLAIHGLGYCAASHRHCSAWQYRPRHNRPRHKPGMQAARRRRQLQATTQPRQGGTRAAVHEAAGRAASPGPVPVSGRL
jgi:hypothetical protein